MNTNFKISLIIKDEESRVYHWPIVPRVGEVVAIGDVQYSAEYEVKKVVHYFRKRATGDLADISLEVSERK